MSKDEPRVRVVVKKKHGLGGHHGGAWKVAYADFVTTMMALFIVLWIIGQNDNVKKAIAEYFRNPGAFSSTSRATPVEGGAGLLPGEPREARESQAATSEAVREVREREEAALREAAAKIEKLIEEGGEFAALRDQLRIELTDEGLRIEMMEQADRPFFHVGSAVPMHPLKPLLESLQRILGVLPNHITIEGHTDARQYTERKNYSNWELSGDRANSARRIMEGDGLPAGRIDRIVGHADRLLRVPDDPLHASNRRISLLVRREAAARAAGPGTQPASPGARDQRAPAPSPAPHH
jgi:chemotaxis protein MotB